MEGLLLTGPTPSIFKLIWLIWKEIWLVSKSERNGERKRSKGWYLGNCPLNVRINNMQESVEDWLEKNAEMQKVMFAECVLCWKDWNVMIL